MTRALRSRAALAACLTVVLGVTGCSAIGGDEWVPLDKALATRQDVRDLTQELAGIIADEGLEPWHANGVWSGCTDDSHAYEYTSSARLDVAEGVALDALPAVLDALVARAGMVTDGPGAHNSPEVALGAVGDLDVRVRAYGDGPELMLDVYGPCMPIAPEDRDQLDQGDVGSQDIPIGGANQPPSDES